MLRLGLTGGIACGKTTVGEMLVARGAKLVQADRIAHQLMLPGEAVYQKVVECFGREILHPDGTIDRAELADAAFNTGRIQELNRIVHPSVIARQDAWMDEIGAQDPHAIAVVEAALIIEAGAAKRFDKLLVVTCTLEQKVERFARRQKLDSESARQEVLRRMDAQLPETDKMKRADYVIDNSGSLAQTEAQVERLFAELQRLAGQPPA